MKQQFGNNFKDSLLTHFEEEQLHSSKEFILSYLELDDLSSKTYLDAGCGSGVFSVAAQQLGAVVTAFDIDEVALENLHAVSEKFNVPINAIKTMKGSILDEDFITYLGKFDIVLCWGVVHHCGEMWKGIENICNTVKDGGLIHFGIYNKADNFGFYPDGRFGSSNFWKKIKKRYSKAPKFVQGIVDKLAVFGIFVIHLVSFKNPIKALRKNERRGMNWQSDLKDWLIGYPYEYATPEEVIEFMKVRGFTLVKLKTNNGLLTNNYVFKKIRI
ncbi:MAG TPA: class I SAM-dependent methyltransferase [Crocinitomicaceae bacterium]|jgi:2-polyprenyl-3-methyl-5-hydroxy-6-metoxy-1,4-benzoquinol methylase|nr:class I SAM-dependent methyltransferase [Crocinitomicaceae bacterium]